MKPILLALHLAALLAIARAPVAAQAGNPWFADRILQAPDKLGDSK